MTIQQGYAAEKYSGKWVYSPATKDEDGVFCHSNGGAVWKMRTTGRFCNTLEEAEQFCKEMNEGLWL
ncbi:hypothetical protein [Phage vB_KsaM-C1]|nr:hypothetical protein [Phage vB_KsaM-C1]